MASSANAQSAMLLLCPFSILKRICSLSESARSDPKTAAAGWTDSGTFAGQHTDVDSVVDLFINMETAASPLNKRRLVAHSSTTSPSTIHSDSEAVGGLLGSIIDSADQVKSDVTAGDLITVPTRLPPICPCLEGFGSPSLRDMARAGAGGGRLEGAVTSGDRLTISLAAVEQLAELQPRVHKLPAATTAE